MHGFKHCLDKGSLGVRTAQPQSLLLAYWTTTLCVVLCAGAVDHEGRVWVWGHGGNWQLGHGSKHHDCEPQEVSWPAPGLHTCMASGLQTE